MTSTSWLPLESNNDRFETSLAEEMKGSVERSRIFFGFL